MRASVRLVGLALLAAAPGAWAGPIVVEESARLQSPDPTLPLNGPLAIHGNTIVAGSTTSFPEEGSLRCAALLFERPSVTGAWSFVRVLTDFMVSDDREQCFLAVDANADRIAISGRDNAFVYERTASGWVETSLPAPGVASDFASDIAVNGDVVVAGGTITGRVAGFIYRRTGPGQWAFETEILAGPLPFGDNDYLGEKVDARGRFIVLGNPDELGDGDMEPGRLYVYRRGDDGRWVEVDNVLDNITPGSEGAASQGISVLEPEEAVGVGAYTDGLGGASVFVEDNPDSWTWFDNVRAVDSLMNTGLFAPFVDALQLNATPGPVSLAVGESGDDDRGVSSGSVTVWRPQIGYEVFTPVVKFLASNAAANLRLGRSLSFHGDTLVAGGGTAAYVFRMPQDLNQPALFQDDFEDGNSAGWTPSSSAWAIATVSGSRVYRQTSTTGEHWSTRGGLNWTNVAIEADVRPLAFNGADRWASLMTRYTNTQNYYYVALRNTNVLRLAKRVGNTFTTLATASLTVTPNRTYRVRLEAIGTWLRVYVDGRLMLQARDSSHARGGVGMKTAFARAEFDNIVVSPNPSLALLTDNFEGGTLSRWTTQGSWSVVGSGGSLVARQSVASGIARAISGIEYDVAAPEMADQVIQARVRPVTFSGGADPWVGLIARYRDNANYTYVSLHRNGQILVRRLNNGAARLLDVASRTITAGTTYTVRLEVVDELVRVYLNGALALEARDSFVDESDTRGRFGLVTSGTAAEFDEVIVTQP